MLRSSTSSSEIGAGPRPEAGAAGATLVERPRLARSVWIALALCLLFRLAIEPLRDLPKADRHEDLYDFLVLERFFVAVEAERPEVLVLGSSISQYNLDLERLAEALGLPRDQVRGLSLPAGGPWDALTLLRRNPQLLEGARLALFDVQPYMLNARYEHAVPTRFYNLATLAEAAELPGWQAVRAVANRLWPFVSFRRPLRAWAMQALHWIRGTTPLERATAFPDWHPESKFYQETEAGVFEALSAPKFQPRTWADVTLGDFDFDERQAADFLELVRRLRAHDVAVLIHQAPFHPDFWARARERPETRAALERYFAFLDELAAAGARLQVWMEPAELGIAPDELPDYGHHTRRLAGIYTRAVAERLRALGLAPGPG